MLEEVFRDEWGRVLAWLVGYLGDFDRAEEAAQEAFAVAAQRWPETGTPPNPAAWLVTTAKNKAIDRIRRERILAEKIHLLPVQEATMDTYDVETVIKDERLELIFTCCHPALPLDGQVALTLRALGGLDTADIARAFLVSEETMKRRLTRAKTKVKATGIPFAIPDAQRLPERLAAVLAVVYLIFNEGYTGRVDLAGEAIRLGRVLAELTADPESQGLLGLMLIHHGRRAARYAGDDLVLLADQDRTLWDRAMITTGQDVLDGAIAAGGRGPYVLQAAIASLQTYDPIDWPQVRALYDQLAALTDSPVVALNRAVALAEAGDPQEALAEVDRLELDGYLYFHSTRGELLRRLSRQSEAQAAYARALELATSGPEQRFLQQRCADLEN